MTTTVRETLDRRDRLKGGRGLWETHWQELAERMRPGRANFTNAQARGAKRTAEIFDSTASQAARGLAVSIDSIIKSEADEWIEPKAAREELNDNEDNKSWLDEVKRRLRLAIYSPGAQFSHKTGETDLDLVTFGTGVLFVGRRRSVRELLFQSCHLRNTYIAENGEGEIDEVIRDVRYTAGQAAQVFGKDNLGAKAREALTVDAKRRDEFTYVHDVSPRRDRDRGRADNRNMPFRSTWIEQESEHLVSDSGFMEFPYAVPRWETESDEVYGRSPGMMALPDVKTVNEMAKTLLKAGQMAVDPPLGLASEAVLGAVNTYPGGLNYIDYTSVPDGRRAIEALFQNANIPLGRDMQVDYRTMIWDAFLRNFLSLPAAGPKMTATEIIERSREFVRVAGPIFGRLKGDYVGRIVPRAFNIIERAEGFPPRPESLVGEQIVFGYETEIDRARRNIELQAPARFAEAAGPIVQVNPTAMDNFDADQITRDMAEAAGFRHNWIKPVDAVAQDRARRQQAQQDAATAEIAERAAKVAPGAAKAVETLAGLDVQGTA